LCRPAGLTLIITGSDAKIAEKCVQIARELPDYFTGSGIANLIQDVKNHQVFALIDYGNVLAFTVAAVNYPRATELLWLATKREHQNKGYGTALLEHIAAELKKNGTRLLEVKTLSPDANYQPYEPTRRFYEKNGFILIDIIDPYPGWEPGNPCALYVKIL
jgi:ribosomal protein S18 acetylase RimI-like enzyme